MKDCIELVKPYLQQVVKPQRYLGGELNEIKKEWDSVQCRFLFAFPDVYDVGMSHLGLQILYEAVNRRSGLLMERTFSPWLDMEAIMIKQGIPLYALESGRPAADFDCIGFTLQHEMSYTNVLQMLKLAGIAYWAKDRGDQDPLIIAGGPCVANVEPLAPFLDAVVVGEGEELLPELLETIGRHKEKRRGAVDKSLLLEELSALEGVYIPSLKGPVIKKARLKEMDEAVFSLTPLVPYIEVVHDRMMVEVLRGCTRGCRFCQAGMIYRPVRERSKEALLAQARALRDNTGHNEIALTSLSSSDHTCIKEIVEELTAEFNKERISISLPSLRANHFSVSLAEEIQKVRRTGFTFAPEAGSQRMRDVINKGVTEEALLATVEKAVSAGWQQIKLYFMIGLPGETMEDVEAIAELCEKVVQAGTRVMKEQGRRGGLRVTCAVSNFVPKAQTPFQWVGQAGQEELKAKQRRLKEKIKDRRISYNYHDAFTSMLEAVFARGGRELAPVLAAAVEKGCHFDSWTEELRRDSWRQAFEELGLDMEALATRSFDLDSPLPWDHLDYGVSKSYLLREYKKSLEAAITGDCRYNGCSGCGVCAFGIDESSGGGSRRIGENILHGEAVDQ